MLVGVSDSVSNGVRGTRAVLASMQAAWVEGSDQAVDFTPASVESDTTRVGAHGASTGGHRQEGSGEKVQEEVKDS